MPEHQQIVLDRIPQEALIPADFVVDHHGDLDAQMMSGASHAHVLVRLGAPRTGGLNA